MDQRTNPLPRLLLRAREVAEMTGLSPAKVYALIASGELPSVKVGRAVRVRATDLDQWIADLELDREEQFGIRRVA